MGASAKIALVACHVREIYLRRFDDETKIKRANNLFRDTNNKEEPGKVMFSGSSSFITQIASGNGKIPLISSIGFDSFFKSPPPLSFSFAPLAPKTLFISSARH
jgi:hypothetical protein